jgi:hypothetical protein
VAVRIAEARLLGQDHVKDTTASGVALSLQSIRRGSSSSMRRAELHGEVFGRAMDGKEWRPRQR